MFEETEKLCGRTSKLLDLYCIQIWKSSLVSGKVENPLNLGNADSPKEEIHSARNFS